MKKAYTNVAQLFRHGFDRQMKCSDPVSLLLERRPVTWRGPWQQRWAHLLLCLAPRSNGLCLWFKLGIADWESRDPPKPRWGTEATTALRSV